jgi:hypothetical protein
MSFASSAMSFVATGAQNLSPPSEHPVRDGLARSPCLPHKAYALAVFWEQLVVWQPCRAIGRDYHCKEEALREKLFPREGKPP